MANTKEEKTTLLNLRELLLTLEGDNTFSIKKESEIEILLANVTDTGEDKELNRTWYEVDLTKGTEELRLMLSKSERKGKTLYNIGNRDAYSNDMLFQLKLKNQQNFHNEEEEIHTEVPPIMEQEPEQPSPTPNDSKEDKKIEIKTFDKHERNYLVVPSDDFEDARKAGAYYDKDKKLSYAKKGLPIEPFHRWSVAYQEASILSQRPDDSFDTDDAEEAMRIFGLDIDGAPLMDDRIHRVSSSSGKKGNKNGWYRAKDVGYPLVIFGDWGKGDSQDSKQVWKPSALSNREHKSYYAKVEVLSKVKAIYSDLALQEEHINNAKTVQDEVSNAKDAYKAHKYLLKKKVGTHGLLLDKRNNLLMPLMDTKGTVWSAQRISVGFKQIGIPLTKEQKANNESFPTVKKGKFFPIGVKDNNLSALKGNLLIAEGYATGATCYEATGIPTIIAVDSGNMAVVGKAIKKAFPHLSLIYAADNDLKNKIKVGNLHRTENAGTNAAIEAAKLTNGIVVIPKIKDKLLSNGASDWNDVVDEYGDEAKVKIAKIFTDAITHKNNPKYVFEGMDGLSKEKAEKINAFIVAMSPRNKTHETYIYQRELRDINKEDKAKNAPRVYNKVDDYYIVAYDLNKTMFYAVTAYQNHLKSIDVDVKNITDIHYTSSVFKDRAKQKEFIDYVKTNSELMPYSIKSLNGRMVVSVFDRTKEEIAKLKDMERLFIAPKPIAVAKPEVSKPSKVEEAPKPSPATTVAHITVLHKKSEPSTKVTKNQLREEYNSQGYVPVLDIRIGVSSSGEELARKILLFSQKENWRDGFPKDANTPDEVRASRDYDIIDLEIDDVKQTFVIKGEELVGIDLTAEKKNNITPQNIRTIT